MSCDQFHEFLQAYTDDSLAPDQAAAVEAHLRECASCASTALAQERLKRAVRTTAMRYAPSAAFEGRMANMIRANMIHASGPDEARPVEAAPEPSGVQELAAARRARSWSRTAWRPALAMAAMMLAVLWLAGGLWSRHAAHEQAIAELVDLHVATLASANPVDVLSTDRHTVKPWFAGKLAFAFNLPELQNSNYRLVGGRVAYFKSSPGAQLLFESGKHRFSVFIFNENGQENGQDSGAANLLRSTQSHSGGASREAGFSVERWSQAGLSYLVISDSGAAEVHALSDLLRAAARG